MQFAIVESDPGFLEPVVMTGGDGRTVSCQRINGERATVDVSRIVHAGVIGEENRPSVIFQWCPAWVVASMQARGYQPLAQRRVANPEEEDEGGGEVQGVKYQSGENKWTPGSRRDRWKEQRLYREFLKPGNRQWSGLDYTHIFGYHRVAQFIEKYRRREIKPESFSWCMIFAALTAAENTKTAEGNLGSFSDLLRGRIALHGIKPGILSFEEFSRRTAGFQEQRFKILEKILSTFPALEKFLSETMLQDRALRRAIITSKTLDTPGLGITKFSFALECYGQDVACLDRWMLRAIGAANKVGGRYTPKPLAKSSKGPAGPLARVNRNLDAHRKWWSDPKNRVDANGQKLEKPTREFFQHVPPPPWEPFSDGSYVLQAYGAGRFGERTPGALHEYEFYEDQLAETDYYKYAVAEGAPNPLARAQWTMWEDVLRRHPNDSVRLETATHSPLFFVIEGKEKAQRLMSEIERGRRKAGRA